MEHYPGALTYDEIKARYEMMKARIVGEAVTRHPQHDWSFLGNGPVATPGSMTPNPAGPGPVEDE